MLFSIITVTRNHLAGLKRTHESVAAQSLTGFEWLVIDGASNDGTVDFLETINAAYSSEPDDGIYEAMNKGIERAQGFYLLFLNAGDTLAHEDTLAEIAAYIEELQETPDFIYGDALETKTVILSDREGSHKTTKDSSATPQNDNYYKKARSYQKAAHGMFTHHQSMLYRRDLPGRDLRYDQAYAVAGDYKFTLQCLERARTVVYCPFPLCLFESGGVSQQRVRQGRAEQIAIRRELGATGPLQNRLIAARQSAAYALRRLFPGLYWRLKRRR